MIRNETTLEQAKFVAKYAAHLMACGVHTSRVIRNAKRIGEALDLDVMMTGFQKSIILTIQEKETGQIFSEVIEIPALPISFKHNSELSALSWAAVDKKMSYEDIQCKYKEIISAPTLNSWLLLVSVGLANASFCHLFKGDWVSMAIVFVATIAGFFVKTILQKYRLNLYLTFIASAFVASAISSIALLFNNITSEMALATSVLFLVPGVPLINGVIDIIEGHTLNGISRLANASLLIVALAIGLSITLILFKGSLI